MRRIAVLLVLLLAACKHEAPLAEPMLVRNATLQIVVADPAKTVDAVTTSVEALGGYVARSEVWREGELYRARITLRVPSDKLTPALAVIRSLSESVERESVSAGEQHDCQPRDERAGQEQVKERSR